MTKNNIQELGNQLKSVLDTLQTDTVKLAEEVKRIHTPKSKKVIKINDKDCFISLIEDGRVMIQFVDKDGAESYYETPLIHSKEDLIEYGMSEYKTGRRHGTAEGRSQKEIEFNRLSFFKRLFY